jgi:hypothetical protein
MSIALLYSDHGFNLAIFTLAVSYTILAFAIRLARQGSDAFGGSVMFVCLKLGEGFFLSVALIGLLGVLDGHIAARVAEHWVYALIALAGGVCTSIDLLFED